MSLPGSCTGSGGLLTPPGGGVQVGPHLGLRVDEGLCTDKQQSLGSGSWGPSLPACPGGEI